MFVMRKSIAILSAAVLCGVLAGTATAATQIVVPRGQSVQIAVVLPDSGPAAADGASARNAVQLAVEKHSSIRGFPIQLNAFDGPCGVPTAFADGFTAASSVVANPQNAAVIGHYCSSSFRGGLPVYEAAGVVTLSGTATNPALPTFGPSVFNSLAVNDDNPRPNGFDDWYELITNLPSDIHWQLTYLKEFGSLPGFGSDLYYDAASVLLDRIAATATLSQGSLVINRASLAAAVRATAGYKGVTCSIDLAGDGWRIDDPASLAKCASTGFGH
jgi:hypothetical protein